MRRAEEIFREVALSFVGYAEAPPEVRADFERKAVFLAIEQAQREAIEEAAEMVKGWDEPSAKAIRSLLPHREGQ